VAPEVLEAMMPFFSDSYGNPSSIHRFGGMIRRHVDRAREQVAALLNAEPEEIYFVSCGSESDNLALQGFCRAHGPRASLITSTVEHPAVQNTCHYLRDSGVSLTEIEVDHEGQLRKEQLESVQIDRHTLASFMWANNETGVIFPLETIADQIKQRGGFLHTDAVQTVGKIPIDLKKTPIDLLSLSGHKLHAPKGVGVLFVRKGTKISPLITGGHQESGLRAGTENVPYIVGLGRACELAAERMQEENDRVRRMRDRLETALLAQCPGAQRNGHEKLRLPNTCNVSFEYIEGEAILLLLDEHGIAASSGSACTSGSLEPSHVMRAMGIPYTMAHSSTRFSLSVYNSDEEVDKVIEVMPGIVKRLRELSPFIESGS
jgi:cysteine desulfurase